MDSAEDRYEILQRRIKSLSLRMNHIIQLSETNKIIIHSNKLSDQIPSSYAGNAFHLLKVSLYREQIQLLCTLWDARGKNKDCISFPAIIGGIDDGILDLAENYAEKQLESWKPVYAFPSGDTLQEQIDFKNNDDVLFRIQARENVREKYYLARRKISKIMKGKLFEVIKKFRNLSLAHYLDQETKGKLSKFQISMINDQVEINTLIDASLECSNLLYDCLKKTTDDWPKAKAHAKLYAEELWNNCTFNIPTSE